MISKRKLVYILHGLSLGGVEVALLSAIGNLMEEFDLSILVLGEIEERLTDSLSIEQKKVFIKCAFPSYAYVQQIRKARNIVLDLNPEIVICSLWRAAWVGAVVKKKNAQVKLVSFIHSTQFPHFAARYFNKKAVQRADLVLADSISAATFVKKNFKLKSTVEVVSFLAGSSPKEFSIREIGLNVAIRFIFLGSIRKVKNLDLAILVMKDLIQLGYDVSLDVYGRQDDGFTIANELIKKLDFSKIVKFKGQLNPEERDGMFKQYHFLIQLSTYEGMAMSVAEGMQHGLPCVVTPVGEIPNYSQDMVSAIFFDPQKWKISMGKIVHVIENPQYYKEIAQNCYCNFQNRETYSSSLIRQIKSLI